MRWLLTVVLLCALGAAAELTTTVETVGTAPLTADAAAAEREATLDAQRLAVEQAAGLLLHSETIVQDLQLVRDTIRTKAAGYLARCEVLGRETVDGALRVRVRAWVKLAPVVTDLLEIEAANQRLGRPRLLVLLDEQTPAGPAAGHPAAREAERLLLAKGFELLDAEQFARINDPQALDRALGGDPTALLEAATRQKGEVALVGRLVARQLPVAVPGMVTAGVSVEARVIEVETGRLVASRTLDLGGRGTPGHSAFDAAAAYDGALRKAATELLMGGEEALIARLLAAWLVRPTTIELTIRGVDFGARQELLAALGKVAGVDEVLTRSFDAGILVLEIRGQGKPDDLVGAMHGLPCAGKRLGVLTYHAGIATVELR